MEGVIGRTPLTVLFPLECLDPPRRKRPSPPNGGINPPLVYMKFCFSKTSRPVFQGQLLGFSPISLKNLASKQAKTRCKSILMRVLSFSADPNYCYYIPFRHFISNLVLKKEKHPKKENDRSGPRLVRCERLPLLATGSLSERLFQDFEAFHRGR